MIHDPEAPEFVRDSSVAFKVYQCSRVSHLARTLFPGGVLIDPSHQRVEERRNATKVALAREDPAIFEATFVEDGLVVTVDILTREGGSFSLIEVRSSATLKDHHLWEAAFKAYVLRRAGVEVDAVEVLLLNDDSRFPDLDDLFVREAISGRVRSLFPQISACVAGQEKMLAGPLPEVAVGKHCDLPHTCPFKPRCWPQLPRHHVETFFGLRRERSEQLGAQGLALVDEVPESFPLTVIQRRQQRSITEEKLQVDGDLAGALAPLAGCVAYLDFQTVGLAIPVWDGMGPWQPHPVQFSCHIASPGKDPRHVEWMAEDSTDCRVRMAEALMEALGSADVVVTYDMAFVRKCLEVMAAGAPAQSKALHAVRSRLRDLLPIVRTHVYHRDFLGSFALSAVLSALVPDLRSDSPEIPRGDTADALLHRLLFLREPEDPDLRGTQRQKLQNHFSLGTLAIMRLKERLDELA